MSISYISRFYFTHLIKTRDGAPNLDTYIKIIFLGKIRSFFRFCFILKYYFNPLQTGNFRDGGFFVTNFIQSIC